MTPEDIAILDAGAAVVLVALSVVEPEQGHTDADEVLCDLLEKLGCHETVKVFRDMEKWYA